MNEFHFDIRIPVTFRDLDAFGHVNNAVYVTYLEDARVSYFREVLGMPILPPHLLRAGGWSEYAEPTLILADLSLAYRSPAWLGETLRVAARVSRLGTKSFDMEYRITEEATERLVGEGKTVQVAFDHAQNRSVPVPERWRAAFGAFESALV